MIRQSSLILAAVATIAGSSPAIAGHRHGGYHRGGHGRPFIQFRGGHHYFSRGGSHYGYGGYNTYGYGYRQPYPNGYYGTYEQPGEVVETDGGPACRPTPYRVEPERACTIDSYGRARLGY